MTHLENEDTRHEVELPDSVIAVIETSIDFNDTLYWENCAYSVADIETVFLEDGGTIECSIAIFFKNKKIHQQVKKANRSKKAN